VEEADAEGTSPTPVRIEAVDVAGVELQLVERANLTPLTVDDHVDRAGGRVRVIGRQTVAVVDVTTPLILAPGVDHHAAFNCPMPLGDVVARAAAAEDIGRPRAVPKLGAADADACHQMTEG